jgi:hypothetical protein
MVLEQRPEGLGIPMSTLLLILSHSMSRQERKHTEIVARTIVPFKSGRLECKYVCKCMYST